MQVIPVIDLKNGLAVHAVRGDRANYRPLQSRWSASAEPSAVLAGLRAAYSFERVYIADLDALSGLSVQRAIIQQLLHDHPDLEFWLDAGWPNAIDTPNVVTVLGSESLRTEHLTELAARRAQCVLSLDYFNDAYRGPSALLDNPALWPHRVILMTLAQVGSQAGPAWARLQDCVAQHPHTAWFAAGGVRDADDLRRLADLGVSGALVATALHRGDLDGPAFIRRLPPIQIPT